MKYAVKNGDSLESIALRYLGSSSYANALWTINKAGLKSGTPTTIFAGETIEIPDQLLKTAQTQIGGAPDEVFVHVNGLAYGGWETVTITRSLEAVSGSFELTITDAWEDGAEPWPIVKGDEVRVSIGPDVVITGYVDSNELETSRDAHSFSISGRDRTADAVDCSAINRPGEFRNKKPEDIAGEIARPYGINVVADVDTGGPLALFRIQPGETVLEAIERIARGRDLLVSGAPDGSMLLTRSGKLRAPIELAEGVNTLRINSSNDETEQFSQYIVEGQGDGQGKAKHTIRATASDPSVKRHRTLIIHAEDKADQAYAERRAVWESRVRSAKSKSVSVDVQGWRIGGGQLWQVNRIVHLESLIHRINEDFMITEVAMKKDEGGTITTLTLKRPDVYLAESELKETTDILKEHKQDLALKRKAKSKKGQTAKKAGGVTLAQIDAELRTLK